VLRRGNTLFDPAWGANETQFLLSSVPSRCGRIRSEFLQRPVGTGCTSNCGGGGNGFVNVTVTSTPSQTLSFPSLAWQILSVQLINGSGGATIVVQGALPPVDFARLQTDSQLLGSAQSVPAGTYTSAKIQLAPSTDPSYFYNSSSATVLGCAPGTVCKIPGTVAGFGATTVTVPLASQLPQMVTLASASTLI